MSAGSAVAGADPLVRTTGAAPEFGFVTADFERVRALIRRKAGISLHAGKHAMVYSRLSRRLRDGGHRSVRDYLDALEALRGDEAEAEWQEFVNCLTTNLTAFFREDHHFPVLAAELAARTDGAIRIWCNAASTGEEPYSIAMTWSRRSARQPTCASSAPTSTPTSSPRPSARLRRRRQGPRRPRLSATSCAAPVPTRQGHGQVGAAPAGRVPACNLMDAAWSLGAPFDIVFCRNVMIYFDAPTQRAVLERMHRVSRPGALLFAGHSENFNESRDLFRLRAKTVYERV